MDNNQFTNEHTQKFQRKVQQMDRHTRYLLHERDNGKGRRKVVSFDERYMQSSSTTIEDLITARKMHIALNRALSELTAEEDEIITECFFEGTKVNYTKLAKKHGISRQAYCQRKKKILKKLKSLVISYYEEF